MNIVRQTAELRDQLNSIKEKREAIGFVPTMGALHQGHLSLIKQSKANTARTVCSIFVNPAQFNDPKDYARYPNTIEKDLSMLEAAGTDIVFIPSVNEVYPNGTRELEHYQLGYLETILEGHYRPGHFQGVAQVMSRLLKIILPNQLFMGQKDYQQCMVIQKLIRLIELDQQVKLQVCATVREADGLAMSSRNLRLNDDERKKAVGISKALAFAKNEIIPGDLTRLEIEATTLLTASGFKVDYFEIAKADSLELVNEWDGQTKLVALAAAFINQVRLIDNMLLN
jgi:pantoate--beta-alanine ligase